MNEYVTDTHSLLWYLVNSASLGKNAVSAYEEAGNGLATIYIPSIVVAELYYLNIKRKYIADFYSDLARIKQSGQFIFVPFEADDVFDFDLDAAVLEMHDRIIVGAARRLGIPLITVDRSIVASGLVPIVW